MAGKHLFKAKEPLEVTSVFQSPIATHELHIQNLTFSLVGQPNWFHRLMQKWFLGFEWKKLNDV